MIPLVPNPNFGDNSNDIAHILRQGRFALEDEKVTQSIIESKLIAAGIRKFKREYRFDKNNIVDFFFEETGIAIEVKIKGSKMEIYRQCKRYAEFDTVKELILLTNKAVALPPNINNKRCTVINLGLAWL